MAYSHAERTLAAIRCLEAETAELLSARDHLDPDEEQWIQEVLPRPPGGRSPLPCSRGPTIRWPARSASWPGPAPPTVGDDPGLRGGQRLRHRDRAGEQLDPGPGRQQDGTRRAASTCRCTVTPACSFSCLAVAEMKSSSI